MSDNIRAYVQLDALLDTRIATVERLDPAAAQAVSVGRYHTRTIDIFDRNGSNIKQTDYERLYEDRDTETLSHATMTWLARYMLTLMSQLTMKQGMPLLSEQISISVDIYPYDLPEAQQASLVAAMETYTNGAAKIDLVSFAPSDMTVSMIKQSYDICFMYDFNAWLMAHTEEFKKVQIPEIRFVVPKLYLKDSPALLRAKLEGEELVWEQMSLLMVGLVGVVFMDVRLFSFITETPPNIEL